MLSDVSELTEFSEDDGGEYVPARSGKKHLQKGKKNASASKLDNGYQLIMKNSLRPPRTATYSAQALYDQILNGSIDLNPEYQRDIVWPESKQSGLIDSMLKNYYIPPVIFAVTVNDDGAEVKTCIDGKQRLTSLQKFMDGQIPHKDSHTGLKFWYCLSKGNLNGRLLPQNYRQQFTNKQIMCVEYDGLMEDAEREIFQRVQLGMALTPAERMHAITGPWAALIRDVINKYFPSSSSAIRDSSSYIAKRKTEDLALLIEWSATRGRDFQLIASIIYYLEKEPASMASIPSHPSAPTLVKWLTRNINPSESLIKKVHNIFTIFILFARDNTLVKIFSKPQRISPAEFIMAGVLISRKMEDCTLEMLANAIAKMKADVRSAHEDIRANTRINKHMLRFIYERFPKKSELVGKGKAANRDNRTTANVVRNLQIGKPPSSSSGAAGKGSSSVQREKKRMRKADTSEDSSNEDNGESEIESNSESEPEEQPTPIIKRGRPAKGAKRTATSTTGSLNDNKSKHNHLAHAAPASAPTAVPSFPTSLDMLSLSLKNTVQATGREVETGRLGSRLGLRIPSDIISPGSSVWQPIDLSQQLDTVNEIPLLYRANELPGRVFTRDVVVKQEYQEPNLSAFEVMTPTSSTSTGSSDRLAGLRAAKARISLASTNAAVDTSSFARQQSAAIPTSSTRPMQTVNLANTDATTLLQMISNGSLQAHLQQIAHVQPVMQPQTPSNPSMFQAQPASNTNNTSFISPDLQLMINELIRQQQQQLQNTGAYPAPPFTTGSITAQESGNSPVTPHNIPMSMNDQFNVPMTPQSLSSTTSQSTYHPSSNFATLAMQADQSPLVASRSSSRSASAALDLTTFSAGSINDMNIDAIQQNSAHPQENERPVNKTVHWSQSEDREMSRARSSVHPRPRPERRGYRNEYDTYFSERNRSRRGRGDHDRSRSPSLRGEYRQNRSEEDDVRFVRKSASTNLLQRVIDNDASVVARSGEDEDGPSGSREE